VAAAAGIKRLGLVLAAIAAIGVGALLILPFLMPPEAVRDAVKAEIRAVTGLDPVLRGATSVSLFPTGTVSFDDMRLGDDGSGTAALTAQHVVARLRFFPFLIGRIEIADISLVHPTITIVFNADRSSNWSSHIDALARNVISRPGRAASFSEIRIQDGTVILRDEADRTVETLADVDFALAWPSISKSFAGTGRFSWHEKQIDATLSFTDFAAALQGDRSGLKLRLAAMPLKVAFDGYISYRPTLRMEGALAADSVSLRDMLRWAGLQPPPGAGFGRFALKAQANIAGTTVGLSSANVELDGNVGEGVLAFDGHQTLQGTLAAETLDLTPYVSAMRFLTSHEQGWDSKPIKLDGFDTIDLDLRLSAARVLIASAKLGRTAVATHLREGNLTVAIGESQAFGGVIKGTFGIAKSPAGADFKAQLQFANVDLEQCLGEMFGIRKLEGKGNFSFAVDSSGSSIYELTKALNGNSTLSSRKGAIAGFNVEQLLRRIERRPLSGGSELRTGKTPFDALMVNLSIVRGVANVDEVRMDGPNVNLMVAGSASISGRELDLKGTASLLSLAPTGTNAAPAFALPFIVQGPWDDPIILPDAQSRIERSGAAAPILDAVRNRGAREAIRSAIERLTGAGPSAEMPPALAGAAGQGGDSTPASQPAEQPTNLQPQSTR
jgi:AsmA protein